LDLHDISARRNSNLAPKINVWEDLRPWNEQPRSKIIPVMNIIAFREEELRKRPDAVRAVFSAFCGAKEIGLDAMQDNRHSGLLWYWESLEDQMELVGYDPRSRVGSTRACTGG